MRATGARIAPCGRRGLVIRDHNARMMGEKKNTWAKSQYPAEVAGFFFVRQLFITHQADSKFAAIRGNKCGRYDKNISK